MFRYFWVVIVVATENRKWIAKQPVDNKIIQEARIPFSEKRGKVFFRTFPTSPSLISTGVEVHWAKSGFNSN